MPTWQALTIIDYKYAGWTRYTSYRHAVRDALVSVVVAELGQLLPHYPLGFSQLRFDDQTERYQLVAVLSLQTGLNLYLDAQHQWQAPYVPAHYRSYPFNLLPNNQGQLTLCFDQDADLIHIPAQNQQIPLFGSDGQPVAELKTILDFLQQLHQNRRLTQSLVDQLAEHQLIQPWELTSVGVDGEAKPVKGLYHINEVALKALDPQPLSRLLQSGAIGLAYAQLYSQYRLHDFRQRFERHQSAGTPDIAAIFGERDDSLFKF